MRSAVQFLAGFQTNSDNKDNPTLRVFVSMLSMAVNDTAALNSSQEDFLSALIAEQMENPAGRKYPGMAAARDTAAWINSCR